MPPAISLAWTVLMLLPALLMALAAPAAEPAVGLPRVRRLVAEHEPVRVVVYGDSISEVKQGWNGGASSPEANWGAVLVKRLGELHPGSAFRIEHFAVGGQNTADGLERLDGLRPLAPDLVLVAFGANDCCHRFLEPKETKRALVALCREIRARHGADVLVVGTGGDNPLKPFFRHLDETLAAQRAAAAEAGVPFVDMRSAVLAATDDGKRWEGFHFDPGNCHPTDRGHEVWAEAAFEVIRQAAQGAEQHLPTGGGSAAASSLLTDRPPEPGLAEPAPEAMRKRGIGDVCWVGDLDPDSPTAGLPGLADVETMTLFEGTPEVGSYSHHGYIFVHQGIVYATWSNHRRDEDAPGQRVLGSRSTDGGRTWEPFAEIFPPQDRTKLASEQDDEHDRVLLANGFAVVEGDLYAVAEAHVLAARRGLGRLARKLSPDGTLGPIFWLTSTPPDPLPGFASYPSGADDEYAELAGQISRFIARPEHLPSWEFVHQTCSPRAADGHQLCEPTQGWRLPDGRWVRLLRDLAVPQTRRNYAQFSADDGLTWTPARQTNFPDACSRSAAGVLPNGTVFVVNNPGSERDPLVISLAGDGLRFDRHAVIRSGAPPVAHEGRWKGAGFQYPRAAVCGDALLVIYSIGKEDVAVSRMPLAALDSIPVSPATAAGPLAAEIRPHLGRPTVFVDDRPVMLAAYSPAGHWRRELFHEQLAHFADRDLNCFFISIGQANVPDNKDFSLTPLWNADQVTAAPTAAFKLPPDEQAEAILRDHPEAFLIVRFGLHEPASWRDRHPEELFVDEDGKTLPVPSLASEAYWDAAARYAAAAIEYAEGRPWADRIVGYADFMRMEGTHEPLISRSLFDHGPTMTARWRQWLKQKYGMVENLRAAHGDPALRFESVTVPRDQLRGPAADVAAIPYWQTGPANAPLRDYLLLQRDLYHAGFRRVAAASAAALEKLGRKRVLVYDSHKSVMLGWDNAGFFDKTVAWRHAYPELMAGSGNFGIASLFAGPGIDGLITPHDYQARGVGGVFEPEGIADSAVLRGKYMLTEMDTRTWAGTDPIAPAKDAAEFAAVTWRNVATALTRGFTPYWMDVYQDWFAPPELQPIIDRQAAVLRESVGWRHEPVPGIAMILDDEAVLETNGDGRFLNEAVLWEWKTGLARSGVPVRIHLIDDLALPNFPPHRVYYFPNLFKIDAARRRLLEEKVLRNGHVVVWGPGTGISDGTKIGPEAAAAVTGFAFDMLPVNDHRRTLLADIRHPLTKGLSSATVLGGPLAYGPVLLPTDGHLLGHAWTKLGRSLAGLAVKERQAADGSTWTSVFTSTPGLPAGFWRNAARHAGAHVWCESDDILLADTELVAIHAAAAGPRTILLPRASGVVDLVTGEPVGQSLREIKVELAAPETRLFRLLPPAARP